MESARPLPIDHTVESVACAIHAVQMSAYAQEARLLGVVEFPPLARTVEDLRAGTESFLGVHVGDQLAGSVSVEPDPEYGGMSIASLTVAPEFQRRGIATALLVEVLRRHGAGCLTVQTGTRNAPALRLYERLGFVRVRHWVVGPESLEVVKLRRFSPTAQQSRAPHAV